MVNATHRTLTVAWIGLGLIPLVLLANGFLQGPQPPAADEGTAAHLFQLSVLLQVPVGLAYVATADWQRNAGRSVRMVAFAAATLVADFGALYFLEHFYIA